MSSSSTNGHSASYNVNESAPKKAPKALFFPNLSLENHGFVDKGTRNARILSTNARFIDHLFIKPARNGDPGSLSAAYNVIRRPDAANFTSQVLAIYASNLKAELIPSFAAIDAGAPDALKAAHCGLESIRGLVFFLQQCVDITPIKKQPVVQHVREHVLPSIPSIFKWLIFLLERSPSQYLKGVATTSSHGVLHACHILDCALLLEDPEISRALRTSREVAELMMTLWLTKNRDLEYVEKVEHRHPGEYIVYCVDELGRCPVTCMMDLIIKNPQSRNTFLETWCTKLQEPTKGAKGPLKKHKYDPVQLMIRSILSRLDQIEIAIFEGGCKPHTAWGALKPLLDIVQALTDPYSFSSSMLESEFKSRILPSFIKESFIRQFAHAIRVLSDAGLEDERSKGFKYSTQWVALPLDCLRYLTSSIFRPFFSDSAGMFTHFVELIRGGVMQVSANCATVMRHYKETDLKYIERGSFYGQLCSEIPRICQAHAIFPPILKALARVFYKTPALDGVTPEGLTEEQVESLNWAIERYDGQSTNPDGTVTGFKYPWFNEIIRIIKEWDDEYRKIRHNPTGFFKDNLIGGLSCFGARHLQCPEKALQISLCGGCRTASYCSEWCQKDDWERHKGECAASRALRRESKFAQNWYSPTWRQFHIWRMNMQYTDHGGYVEHRQQPSPTYVARVNFCKDQAVWHFFPCGEHDYPVLKPDAWYLARYAAPKGDGSGALATTAASQALIAQDEDSDRAFLSSFQYNARFAEFLEWAKDLPLVDNEEEYWRDIVGDGTQVRVRLATMRRLVEGVFPFGDKVILLTVKYSITRSFFGEDNKTEIVQLNVLESLARVVPTEPRSLPDPKANGLLNGPGPSGKRKKPRNGMYT